jgi:hypothetical protein
MTMNRVQFHGRQGLAPAALPHRGDGGVRRGRHRAESHYRFHRRFNPFAIPPRLLRAPCVTPPSVVIAAAELGR